MKYLRILILAIVVLLHFNMGFSADIQEVDGLKYEWVSYNGGDPNNTMGKANLVGYTNLKESITIPYSIKWPKGTHKGREVKITSISDYAFQNCTSLKSIDFSSISLIDKQCFAGCSSLSEIHINNASPPDGG